MTPSNSTTFKASCHCKSFSQTLTIPSAAFPLKSAICQCESCRHVTGHIFVTFAVIPGPLPDASWFTCLSTYTSSKTLDRYFCPVCGASVLNIDRGNGVDAVEWELATGVLEFDEQGDGKGSLDGRLNRALMWVADSLDGGVVEWINDGQPEGLAGRFLRGRDSETVTREHIVKFSQVENSPRDPDEVLQGHCRCGKVAINVLAPDPDASPKDCSAEFCACTSCRKTSGFEVTSWTHIARDKVRTSDGERYQEMLAKLGHYESSRNVHRYFCRTCGATVFYDRPELSRIDVALGLFAAAEGSKAQRWFVWNPDKEDVAFMDDAIDKQFVGRLADGVGRATRQAHENRVKTSAFVATA